MCVYVCVCTCVYVRVCVYECVSVSMCVFCRQAWMPLHTYLYVVYVILSASMCMIIFHNSMLAQSWYKEYILFTLQSLYHTSNPYHNCMHAADVMQSVHTLLNLATFEVSVKLVYMLRCVNE